MSEKEYREMIYAKAREVKTSKQLTALIKEITDFNHDYGTIVYGCMAAMNAAFNVVNDGPQGGITGFQAGCLGWECVHEFMMIKPPAKILDYNNMLYPQYQDKFDKTISSEIWESLQKQAKENIKKEDIVAPIVLEHWKSVAAGNIPFGYRLTPEESAR